MIDTFAKSESLTTRLREQIRREGPITFCDWMASALYDEPDGYYCKVGRTRWGREGDYRTSPERSELFAATFAGYFSKLHAQLGRPEQWTILECGAGEGHFAEGVLQTLQTSHPRLFAGTSYIIDEVSPSSRALAQQRLGPFADRVKFQSLEDLEIDCGVVFSNELLDAFPVHRVTVAGNQLREFYVNVGADGAFEWTTGELSPELAARISHGQIDVRLDEAEVTEVSLEIEGWFGRIAKALHRGYVVTVDYGAGDSNLHGTLRGFQRHQFVDDLLAQPGEHDLTTSVNWDLVKSVGKRVGLDVLEFERQDKFLLSAGLLEQLKLRSRQARSEAERLGITTAARDMVLPDGMAAHFQVLVQQKT